MAVINPDPEHRDDVIHTMIGGEQPVFRKGMPRERRLEIGIVEFIRAIYKHHNVLSYFPDEVAGAVSRMVALVPRKKWKI